MTQVTSGLKCPDCSGGLIPSEGLQLCRSCGYQGNGAPNHEKAAMKFSPLTHCPDCQSKLDYSSGYGSCHSCGYNMPDT